MSDIIDLGQKRIEKAIEASGSEPLGERRPGAQLVEVISCNCGSFEFRLGHRDPVTGKKSRAVFCARCNVLIDSLRWYDVNSDAPLPPAT